MLYNLQISYKDHKNSLQNSKHSQHLLANKGNYPLSYETIAKGSQ